MSWWAQKLAGQQPSAPAPAPVQAPGYSPFPQYPQFGSQPQHYPQQPQPQQAGGGTFNQVLANGFQGTADVTKSQAAREEGDARCPSCNSGNYFSLKTASRMDSSGHMMPPKPHCYDCGFPVEQSGSGAGIPGVQSTGPVQSAKQLPIPVNNFHGSQIVARVG